MLNQLFPNLCLVCEHRSNQAVCFRCWPETINLELQRCKICFRVLDQEQQKICNQCILKPPIYYERKYIWDYRDQARDFIRSMKYEPNRKLCKIAGQFLAEKIQLLFKDPNWDLVIPIPPSKESLKTRAFNPVDYLCKYIPDRKYYKSLAHLGYKSTQAKLKYKDRLKNMRNVFNCKKDLSNLKILLVDDVYTTGATIDSATLALSSNNAKMISILTLAMNNAE